MEVIGTYDPIPKPPKEGEGKAWKDIKLDTARAKYWLGVGAQPSEPAWRLLSLVGSCLVYTEKNVSVRRWYFTCEDRACWERSGRIRGDGSVLYEEKIK